MLQPLSGDQSQQSQNYVYLNLMYYLLSSVLCILLYVPANQRIAMHKLQVYVATKSYVQYLEYGR